MSKRIALLFALVLVFLVANAAHFPAQAQDGDVVVTQKDIGTAYWYPGAPVIRYCETGFWPVIQGVTMNGVTAVEEEACHDEVYRVSGYGTWWIANDSMLCAAFSRGDAGITCLELKTGIFDGGRVLGDRLEYHTTSSGSQLALAPNGGVIVQ